MGPCKDGLCQRRNYNQGTRLRGDSHFERVVSEFSDLHTISVQYRIRVISFYLIQAANTSILESVFIS